MLNIFTENNSPPVAVTGPDKELTFPVESTILDGSKSQDDQGIVFYHWENVRYLEILLTWSKRENEVEVDLGAGNLLCSGVSIFTENFTEDFPVQVAIG